MFKMIFRIEFDRMLSIAVAIAIVLTSAAGVSAQEAEDSTVQVPEVVVDGTLHESFEIMRLLEASTINYEIMGMPDSIPEDTLEPIVLPPAIFMGRDGSLMTWSLPDSIRQYYDSIETVYEAEDYGKAAEMYKELYQRAPGFTYALTLVGDAYVLADQYDSAIVYLKKSIEYNFIDYQAHWYLSKAYWYSNRDDEGLREIHLAHLLNPNHQLVVDQANEQRALQDLWPLGGWRTPRYLIKQIEGGAQVFFEPEWIGYALVKALWEAEPGYREKMAGDSTHWVVAVVKEEKEAIASYLVDSVKVPLVDKIAENDNFDQFVIYEFLASKNPSMMAHFSPEWLNHLADYMMLRDQYWAILSRLKESYKENGGQ